MRKVGQMWILDDDEFFAKRFAQTGDKFDYAYLEYALTLVKNWGTALDCGGHYGSWTRPMAAKFKHVHTFEPRDDLFECLVKNTEHLSNVTRYKQAVGERMGSVTVATPERYKTMPTQGNSGLATILGEGNTPLVTIDSLNLTDVGFIKIDTEGYELHVLEGARETLLRCKPVVIFEENSRLDDHKIKRGECGKYLVSLGAKLNRIFPGENHIYTWE